MYIYVYIYTHIYVYTYYLVALVYKLPGGIRGPVYIHVIHEFINVHAKHKCTYYTHICIYV